MKFALALFAFWSAPSFAATSALLSTDRPADCAVQPAQDHFCGCDSSGILTRYDWIQDKKEQTSLGYFGSFNTCEQELKQHPACR